MLNIALFAVDMSAGQLFYVWLKAKGLAEISISFSIASLFVLPIAILLEMILMRDSPKKKRAIIVDAAFSAIYLIVFGYNFITHLGVL